MKRLKQLLLPFLTLVLASQVCEAKRPNILFIYTDDHTHRSVGCYPESHDWVSTPNIDQLAKSGTRFTHAYIGTWCMPSRATMLTGLHPYGCESMRMEGDYPGSAYDPEVLPFWPKVFRQNGYVTAQIGKWHTGVDTGANRDWDYQVVWNRPRYIENAGNYFYDQLLETNGGDPVMTSGYSTDNYTNLAVDFINGKHRDESKPWYLWLCYSGVHSPYTPAERHREEYPDIKVTPPADIFPPRAGKPKYVQDRDLWELGPDGEPRIKGGEGMERTTAGNKPIHGNSLTGWVRQYHQAVIALDEGVGKVMQALRVSGQLDNTLVVFTSDQGYAWGQHGFKTKLAPYDATIRSPLIVSMPGKVSAGAVCQHPIGGTDLPVTFFSFAGLDLPWKMHGHDITPLLKNAKDDWDHPVLTTLLGAKYGSETRDIPSEPGSPLHLRGIPWWISLAEGRYKYIRTLQNNEIEELYDLKRDPEELNNLAINPRFTKRLGDMRQKLVAELERTDAPLVDTLPPVRSQVK